MKRKSILAVVVLMGTFFMSHAQKKFLVGSSLSGAARTTPTNLLNFLTIEPTVGYAIAHRNILGLKVGITRVSNQFENALPVLVPTRYTYKVFNRFYFHKLTPEASIQKYWHPYLNTDITYTANSFYGENVDNLDGKRQLMPQIGLGNNMAIYKNLKFTIEYNMYYFERTQFLGNIGLEYHF